MSKKKPCSFSFQFPFSGCFTASLYWPYIIYMHILHMSGGYIGHRSGWRPSLSMPWSLLPASPSSAFLSKCGVASVTVSNVAAEGERRRNLRQFESSTRGGFSRRGRFQATDPSCAVNSVTLTEEVRRRRFESSTKRRTLMQRRTPMEAGVTPLGRDAIAIAFTSRSIHASGRRRPPRSSALGR